MIITRDTERILEIDDKTIEVIPAWKWTAIATATSVGAVNN